MSTWASSIGESVLVIQGQTVANCYWIKITKIKWLEMQLDQKWSLRRVFIPSSLTGSLGVNLKSFKVHGGIPINISSSNKDEGILASASSRPKGFRLNLRKLGNQSQAMSQVEKENLSDVLDVLLKYSKISNDSSCPYIQGQIRVANPLVASLLNSG